MALALLGPSVLLVAWAFCPNGYVAHAIMALFGPVRFLILLVNWPGALVALPFYGSLNCLPVRLVDLPLCGLTSLWLCGPAFQKATVLRNGSLQLILVTAVGNCV